MRVLYGKRSGRNNKVKEEELNNKDQYIARSNCNNNVILDKSSQSNRSKKLPENLPREKTEYTLPKNEQLCNNCGRACKIIGEDISEQLEYIPAKLFVKQTIRCKYGCPIGCSVKMAKIPERPIEKSIAGAGLLADILVSKYQDAMPIYRQISRFKRYGVQIAESTANDWVSQCAVLLEPIVLEIKADLLLQNKLHTDDTPHPVLDTAKAKQARLWVYVSDQRNSLQATVYDYSPNRSKSVPEKFLKGFSGYLQVDAYPGYDQLYATGKIIEVGCLAHVRRKFYEISIAAKGESKADDALSLIASIYSIEQKISGYSNIKRYYYRKRHLKNYYKKFKNWLLKQSKKVIAGVPLYKAIMYALNNWRALQNVFAHGSLEVDNNTAERAIKPVVIGRKNYLFVGNHAAGKRAAVIYSLIETCKQNSINPFNYLRDVLNRLPKHPAKKIRELLPYNWQPEN